MSEDAEQTDEPMTYETSEYTKMVGYDASSFEELIGAYEAEIAWLKELQAAGVKMVAGGDGHFQFTTEDFKVAKRFGMLPWDYWEHPERYPEWNDTPPN
jgi:hypothetical protein